MTDIEAFELVKKQMAIKEICNVSVTDIGSSYWITNNDGSIGGNMGEYLVDKDSGDVREIDFAESMDIGRQMDKDEEESGIKHKTRMIIKKGVVIV